MLLGKWIEGPISPAGNRPIYKVSMPRDALHYGSVENRELHNAYGYYFHMATANGLLKRGNGKDCPFVLSRYFFPGSQRYGAIWTGDNTTDWDHLRVSIPMVLTLGLSAISFSGADVGGFFGNPEPELLVRWYQVGAYYPFFRAHAHQYTKRREPCLFGERNTELMREAIHVRYMYLPYFYTLFREANMTGTPVLRPLWIEFPADEETFSNNEAFIVGNSLLVQGIYTEVVAYLMVTSMAGLGQIVYLAYNGDQKITWSEACSSYGKFCNRLKLILAFQFLALSCFLLLAIISAYRLFSRFDPPILPSKDAEEEQN